MKKKCKYKLNLVGVILVLLFTGYANAQITITGTVSSTLTDEPLPGANVVIKGSTTGVVTNMDGSYTINVPDENSVLVFSFIGYIVQEYTVGSQTEINVSLNEDITELTEVVVIGYGTQQKGDVTSAIASIKADEFIEGGVQDVGQLIQGKVAGLTIYSTSGDPQSNTQVRLRGTNTLWGTGTDPLILIDGVPGDFNSVAPDDIESIDVLKDGSAAAIYGTRGTNGVIIITTKRASGRIRTAVHYRGYVTTQTIAKKMEMFTAEDYRQQIADGLRDSTFDLGASTDWMDEITQTPVSHVHSLTFKGGDEKTNYLASVNYRDEEGLIKETDYNYFTARADVNHSMLNNRLKFNVGVLSRFIRYNTNADGRSFSGYTYRQALIRNPTAPVKDENGDWHEQIDYFYYENPVAHLYESDGENKSQWNRINGTFTFKPVEGLRLNSLVSFSRYNQTRGYSETKKHFSTVARNLNGFASNGTRETTDRLIELTADYAKKIGNHRFTILGGYSYQDYDMKDYWMRNVDFPTDVFGYSNIELGQGFDKASADAFVNGEREKTNLIGFFGRATYNFKDKYLFMGSLRYEAASQLVGTEDPWGTFPAVSVGWRITNEPFMQKIGFINDLKLRVGYGITGTQPNRLFHGKEAIRYGDAVLVDGEYLLALQPERNPNPYLRWEEKAETNIGMDFWVLNNRIGGAVDYYIREISGLLYEFPVPVPPNQNDFTFANAGVMRNEGMEILLNIIPVRNKNIEWTSAFTFSTNKNKLVSLGNELYEATREWIGAGNAGEPIWGYTHRLDVGGEVGNFWGYKVVDVTEDGEWIYLDSMNNICAYDTFALVDENRHILGNGIPRYFVSWNNMIRYKNFDFAVTMRGAFKFQILNRQRMYYENTSIEYYNRLNTAYDELFGKAVLSNNMPLQYNSYFIEDGDYWKIDNITIGYTFRPKSDNLMKYFQSARVYFSTLNTLTFTNYKGVDPEVNIVGLEPGNDGRDKYPTVRSFTFGIDVKF